MQNKKTYFCNLLFGTLIIMAIFYACKFSLEFLNIKFPAALTGMVVLFLALTFRIIPLGLVEDACNFFLKYMVFFFVPLLVMLPDSYEIFKKDVWTIIIGITLSAIFTLAVTAIVVEKLHAYRTEKGALKNDK